MAIAKASRAPFLLALLFAALVSSCYASRDATGEKLTMRKVIEPMADPKCDVMERCDEIKCMDYCIKIRLGMKVGFYTSRGMQFYCIEIRVDMKIGFCIFRGMQFYCIKIRLGMKVGFCTFRDMQFYRIKIQISRV